MEDYTNEIMIAFKIAFIGGAVIAGVIIDHVFRTPMKDE